MKEMKRILSLVLCFVMVVGLLPVSVFATDYSIVVENERPNDGRAESDVVLDGKELVTDSTLEPMAASDPIYVLAGGDFQEGNSDGSVLHVNSAQNVRNILSQMSQKYPTMDGMLFMGDYDGTDHNNATNVANGIASLMSTVQETYSNINHDNSILVQGNHDNMDSHIDATGGHDFNGYSVYVLNEDDYVNGGGSKTQIQALANNLEAWLNNKLGEAYSAPVFVVSHLPLAFSPRTIAQGDGKYAKYIFDALNTAADNGLNIIFLHGHDHAWGCDNHLGGEAIYLAKGDKIDIADPDNTSTWTSETLNFTYMNAGYTGYYNESGYTINERDDTKLTMTVFKIESNQVTVERYSADGVYNLKSAGRDGAYSGTTSAGVGLTNNTTVYTSPQTISLGTLETAGTIGEYVGVADETPADDVKPSGGSWVEVVAPVPGTGANDVTPSGNEWVTLTTPGYVYTQATSITAGDEYVIVGDEHSVALMDNNGTMGSQTVTISGSTMTSNTALTEWTFSGRTNGTIYNGTRYLRYSSNNFNLNRNNSTNFTITDNDSNFRIQSGNYSFYYDGSSWTRSGNRTAEYVRLYQYSGTANGLYAYLNGNLSYNATTGMTAEQALAMVKEGIAIHYATAADYRDEQTYLDDGDGITWTLDPNYNPAVPGDYAVTIALNGNTIGVAEVIVTLEDKNGTYYKLSGDLTYDVELGTSTVMAEDAVKTGITVYKYEGMSAPGDGVTGTAISDSEVTWTLDANYNGNTAGDYALTISKDGVELGTAEVVVPAATTYYIAEGNGMYYVAMNTSAADALATVKAGVTVSSATSTKGANKTEISDDNVTWKWVDTYNGADSGPYTVEILYNGTSLGTVEVKVNVKYETGIADGWTEVGETAGSSGVTYERIERVSELVSGEQYLIIFDCSNQTTADAFVIPTIVTTGSGSSQRKGPDVVASNGITDNATITGDYDKYLWTLTESGSGWKIGNGSQYINVAMNSTSNRGELSFTNSGEVLTIATGSNNPSDANSYSFAIRDSSSLYWQYNTSATLIYATDGDDYTSRFVFYGRKEGTTTPAGKLYAKLEGDTLYTVEQGTSATEALKKVKEGITGWLSSSADGSNPTEIDDGDLKYTWKNTYTGSVVGSYWVEISYNGVVLGTVEVKVEPGVINNYPEYPDEGAVKVNKTATGVEFQSSGVAQVEISASGVPIKRGADVIVMLDTSSSMAHCLKCGTRHDGYVCNQGGQTRAQVLEATLSNLITQFNTPGDDGELLDIRVAVADFNGFNGYGGSTGTPYDRDAADYMNDTAYYTANGNNALVYTGDGKLGAGAFVNAVDLKNKVFDLHYDSGTNYDYAMDAIYQLGAAVKSADRDLFVIFMSDGAAMQWNYYHSQGASNLWENWITGKWTASDLTSRNLHCTEHSYYYDLVDHDGDGRINEHRMANAIKGDPAVRYEVIRKSTAGIADIQTGSNTNLYTVPGLGATMFSIAFDPMADTNVEAEHMVESIATLASDQTGSTQYFYNVASEDALASAFTAIGSEIAYAASNARFVDQMGSNFNLQMTPIVDYAGNPITDAAGQPMLPSIEIISYDIWTRSDYEAGTITEDQIGVRKGTYTVLETVTFTSTKNEDGTYTVTGAYSDQIDGGQINILADGTKTGYVKGVIYAKTFIYNTNSLPVAVDGVKIPTGTDSASLTTGTTNELPGETFYWKMGTIQSSELAMRYYVYLDGSMEGTKNAGSYATNNFATLYYDNYLGNSCYMETVSPTVAWKSANVSYAFYLVNENGQIIVNQTTGEIGTFANKIAVTDPVVYEEILLNNTDQVQSIDVAAISDDVLPKYYTLYDEGAVYEIRINSDATGNWVITNGGKAVNSTYVTNYTLGTAYSNALTEDSDNYDYTHTVVWFAVVWKLQAHPDSVVIDFGLPVDITVMANDMFGTDGKLAGIGPVDSNAGDDLQTYYNNIRTDTMKSGFSQTYTGQYGVAQTDLTTGKIRYTPSSMIMNGYDRFAYAVQYSGTANAGYYYDIVTVIPATTIYYEDEYVTLKTYDVEYNEEECVAGSGKDYFVKNDNGSYTWVMNPEVGETYYVQTVTKKNGWPENSEDSDKLQEEDRPGQYSLGTTDANNPYGYDGVYDDMSSYSMGHAAMIDVSSNRYGTAEFSFWGTGFDVISMTSNTTGVLLVDIFKVENGAETKVKSMTVDTYFGYAFGVFQVTYTKNADGVWELTAIGDAAEGETAKTKEEIIADAGAGATKASGYQEVWKPVGNEPNALYQVPVINADLETYAQYKVVLTAMYFDMLNHTADATGYDLYLDAIRIYNPAGDPEGKLDGVIESAYSADGELFPKYYELRNKIIDANNFDVTDTDAVEGIVFIDGAVEPSIENYTNYGPNNELYLAKGQSIAFSFKADPVANYNPVVRIGLKTVGGTGAVAEMWNAVATVNEGKTSYSKVNTMSFTLNTATDMFYDITALVDRTGNEKTIVITNSGAEGSILSITDIKVTYKPTPNKSVAVVDPSEVEVPDAVFTVSKEVVEQALATLPRKVIFLPVEMEIVDKPIKKLRPVEPVLPVKPTLPTDPIKPVLPIRPAVENAVTVSIEETVVRNRRVLG